MSLRLLIEASPTKQLTESVTLTGPLSIGRGNDADWKIHDPDNYVSRMHCVVTEDGDGGWKVTDGSRGGLFIDGSPSPLGLGNSATLEAGMRLRMGDIVLRVEPAHSHSYTKTEINDENNAKSKDAFFGFENLSPGPVVPSEPQMEGRYPLPDPFEDQSDLPVRRSVPHKNDKDDDFERIFEGGREFDNPPEIDNYESGIDTEEVVPAFLDDPFFNDHNKYTDESLPPKVEPPFNEPFTDSSARSERFDTNVRTRSNSALEKDQKKNESTDNPSSDTKKFNSERSRDNIGRDASPDAETDKSFIAEFLKGVGLEPGSVSITTADAEAIGRTYRLMVDGLVAMTQIRAQIKQTARVRYTVVGAQNVNPVKFAPNADTALLALLNPPRPGYLDAEQAIQKTFEDLNDHQLRSLSATQSAIRGMIERFSPERIEAALAEESRMNILMSGGRGARLWKLYEENFKRIADSAEEKFLGEVGAEFRDAYESYQGRRK